MSVAGFASQLLEFLTRVDEGERDQYAERLRWTLAERIARGYSLVGLRAHRSSQTDQVVMNVSEDLLARFRVGDEVELSGEAQEPTWRALVARYDRQLVLSPQSAVPRDLFQHEWKAELTFRLFSKPIRDALVAMRDATGIDARRLGRFEDAMNTPTTAARAEAAAPLVKALNRTIIDAGIEFNPEQRRAALEALTLSPVWAVWGPPGTGKTEVAAVVAETLCRQGKRVLLSAFTHEAVRRMLESVHRLFPSRPIAKLKGRLDNEPGSDVPYMSRAQLLRNGFGPPANRTLVGTTVHSALALAGLDFKESVDAVLVDEAGQLPLTMGAALGVFGAPIIALGDPAQLSPIFPDVLRGDARACSFVEWLARRCANPGCSLLRQTHRFGPTMAAILGDAFYPGVGLMAAGNPLAAAASSLRSCPTEWLSAWRATPHPLLWAQVVGEGRNMNSAAEATAAIRLVDILLTSGYAAAAIGIVTPFRAQIAQIRRLLSGRHPNVRVDTVERMQGQTLDVTIVSVACSNSDFARDIQEFLFNPHRLNVSLSRAREMTIVLIDPRLLVGGSSGSGEGDYREFVELLRTSGKLISLDPEG